MSFDAMSFEAQLLAASSFEAMSFCSASLHHDASEGRLDVGVGLGDLDHRSRVPLLLQLLLLQSPDVLAHALVDVGVLRVRLDHVPPVFPELINLGSIEKVLLLC